MRRAPIVLTSTVLATAAVLGFQPRKAEVGTTAATVESGATAPSSPSTGGTSGNSSSATGTGSGSAGDASSSSSGTATGDAIDTIYGAAQVKVTVTGGKITKVEAVRLQDNDPHSAQISRYAAPMLAQSALEKQSAAIDVVSGATYTSRSYAASLQSALDTLGFQAADGAVAATDTSQLQQGEAEGHGRRHGG